MSPRTSTRRQVTTALVAGLVAVSFLAVPAGARRSPAPRWRRHSDMSHPRTEAAFALSDGVIYAVGGFGPSLATVPLVETYDVASDTWADAPPLPVAVNHAMAAAHEGVVYVAGGYTAVTFGAVPTAFAFEGGVWTPLAPMPETRAAAGMVVHDDKLYVIGGFSQQGELATTTLVYDIAAGTWTTEEGMPEPREHLAVVEHGGFVYTIGGRIGSPDTNSAVVERFDPRKGKWTTLPPMLQTRSGHTCAVTANALIACLGGEATGMVFATAEAYDIAKRRWFPLPVLDPGRTGVGSAAVGNTLYTFFGASDTGYLANTESLDLSSY